MISYVKKFIPYGTTYFLLNLQIFIALYSNQFNATILAVKLLKLVLNTIINHVINLLNSLVTG